MHPPQLSCRPPPGTGTRIRIPQSLSSLQAKRVNIAPLGVPGPGNSMSVSPCLPASGIWHQPLQSKHSHTTAQKQFSCVLFPFHPSSVLSSPKEIKTQLLRTPNSSYTFLWCSHCDCSPVCMGSASHCKAVDFLNRLSCSPPMYLTSIRQSAYLTLKGHYLSPSLLGRVSRQKRRLSPNKRGREKNEIKRNKVSALTDAKQSPNIFQSVDVEEQYARYISQASQASAGT